MAKRLSNYVMDRVVVREEGIEGEAVRVQGWAVIFNSEATLTAPRYFVPFVEAHLRSHVLSY